MPPPYLTHENGKFLFFHTEAEAYQQYNSYPSNMGAYCVLYALSLYCETQFTECAVNIVIATTHENR